MMRVILDMQGAQTASRDRGIGRYTMDFARALAQRPDEVELLLLLNGAFEHTVASITATFEGLVPAHQICVWHPPFSGLMPQGLTPRQAATSALIREAFIQSLQPDLVHICSFFEGHWDPAVLSAGQFDHRTAVSVTLYDLIPLVHPQHYLSDAGYATFYHARLKQLQSATCLLAISTATAQQAIDRLALSEDQLVVTACGVDAAFRPAQASERVGVAKVLQSLQIAHPFLLYVGSSDPRKNLSRLLRAYAALPFALRQNHQLVLSGPMPDEHRLSIRALASSLGLQQHQYRVLGHVSNEELLVLYQAAKGFVFPTWDEGFGLPLLEAMACGVPTIAADIPSLREIKQSGDGLFDPFDEAQMSACIERLLVDALWCEQLVKQGLARAAEFSWARVADRAIQAWKRLVKPQASHEPVWAKQYQYQQQIQSRLLDELASQYEEMPDTTSNQEVQDLAICCAANERELFRYARSVQASSLDIWRLEGPFDSSYSLALVNRELARGLLSLGKTVVLHSTEGPGDFQPNEAFLCANPDLDHMHRVSLDVAQRDADVVSRNLYPPRVTDMQGRLNCLHAYAWEETGFPMAWMDAFNESLQGITVTSRHVQKVLIDQGLRVPIAVCGLGTDHWVSIEPQPIALQSNKSFRFLHVSSCFPRKGVEAMLRAYGMAFRRSDDVVLIIKTFQNPHNEVYEWLYQCRQVDPDYPDVEVLEGDWPEAQIKGLMQACHALVAPSHAEGFGLPMAEAMMTGLPVITTGWGGQTDFCTAETSYLIDYTFEPAQSHFELSGSIWAKPDQSHLARLLREVHDTPFHERVRRAQAGQSLLMANFQWQQCAQRVVDAAQQFDRVTVTRQPKHIAWVSTWATRCGIATYSAHLIDHLEDPVTVLANQISPDEIESEDVAKRCWQADGQDDLQNLAIAVDRANVDTVVVQFNYGFFNLKHFARFLDQQVDLGTTVVVCLHSTLDPEHQPEKRLGLLTPALRRCARLLVHTLHDVNRLKLLGLTRNVTLFPHGVWVPTTGLVHKLPQLPRARFRLATYGFMLPHKGLVEMVRAVGLLNRRGIPVELLMCNAYYPNPISVRASDAVRQTIQNERLQGLVELDTRFHSEAASLSRLATADLVVYPYQETNESSSGAIRFGLASGVPVVVTPLAIFDDVAHVVHTLPGFDPELIADGIEHLLWQRQKQTDVWQATGERAMRWTAQHDFRVLGQRLQSILRAIGPELDER